MAVFKPAPVSPHEVHLYARAIGRLVKEVREEHGITVMQLAARTGISWAQIHRVERGGLSQRGRAGYLGPTLGTLIRIARGLGVSPRELLP